MTNGISYPTKELDEKTRLNLVKKQLKKGNHTSSLEEEAIPHVTKAMKTDVTRGFGIILTKKCIKNIY